jgi:hypothetical protein
VFARNYTFDLCCQTARHAENRFRMRIQSAPLPRMCPSSPHMHQNARKSAKTCVYLVAHSAFSTVRSSFSSFGAAGCRRRRLHGAFRRVPG